MLKKEETKVWSTAKVGEPGEEYGDRGYTVRGNSWMAQRQLAQEDYADAGPRTNRGSILHTHETRAHSAHGRKAKTLAEAGAWAVPTAGWWIKHIKENEHTLWLVGRHYARAAGLGSSIATPARHSRP